MPVAAMSIGRCGASCAASMKKRAPWACASAASCALGHTSPVTFEAPVTATRSIRSRLSACSQALQSSSAECAKGSSRRSWRRQGSMLAWCSARLLRTLVPGGNAAESTLIASVVLGTSTTSWSGRLPTKRPTAARARSYASVASCDLKPLP